MSPATVLGLRAPINLRRDGLLCDNIQNDSILGTWIGIQDFPDIAQIGFVHFWSDGNSVYCHFWANGTGAVNPYGCQEPDNTTVFFRIEESGSGENRFYSIEDCGTEGDFQNCTPQGTQALFTTPSAEALSEIHHPCAEEALGSSSSKVDYGNNSWNLAIDGASGWYTPAFNSFAPSACSSDYSHSVGGNGVTTWDTRNNS